MTANNLRAYFNNTFGIIAPWPKTFEVDAETYANCCQEVFNNALTYSTVTDRNGSHYKYAEVLLSENYRLIFKNVELILKEKK